MVYQPGSAKIKCPFCGQEGVTAFHRLSFLQANRSSISAGSKTTYTRRDEVYEIAGDCPNCGAKEKDIYKKVNGIEEKKEVTSDEHQKRIERLKAAGFGTKLVTTRR